MFLTEQNYYSREADLEYMSVSQFKLFEECEEKALAIIKGDFTIEQKDAFLEGELFEALVAGDAELFYAQHPEIIASRGATKGELKANFKKVLNAAKRFNEQDFFKDIINRSQKQVILTGTINGVKIKGRLDLLDLKNKLLPDIKCMADYKDSWDKDAKCYKPWYYTYNYVLQLAVYQELVRQNYNIICDTCLLSASKEEIPDLQALIFDNELLKVELENFANKVKYYDDLKKGIGTPQRCNSCDHCKMNKKITNFEEVK